MNEPATFVRELLSWGAATAPQIEEATRRASVEGGFVQSLLIDLGCASHDVMAALSATSGIPLVPAAWLRTPAPAPSDVALGSDLARRLVAAPVCVRDGVLQIVFADPESAEQLAAMGLVHRAHLATEAEVRRRLDEVYGTSDVKSPAPTLLMNGNAVRASLGNHKPAAAKTLITPRDVSMSSNPQADAATSVDVPTPVVAPVEAPVKARVHPAAVSSISAALPEPAPPPPVVVVRPQAPPSQPTSAIAGLPSMPPPAATPPSIASTPASALMPPPVPHAVLGAGLDRFVIGDKLGAGGMASVHIATDRETGEHVALKLIVPHAASDPAYVTRFQREVRSTAAVSHPNIARVIAFGDTPPQLFMAMELVDGGTLNDLIYHMERVPAPAAALIIAQLLAALGAAHGAGLVHRDIKPANVMISRYGEIKLVDFGIAKGTDDVKVTQTGFLVGTPAYMSPEQALGDETDARSDLFSAGVLLYEMLTGSNPYATQNPSLVLLKIAQESLPPVFEVDPTVPGVLELVLERLLDRSVTRRYQNAHQALEDLGPYLAFAAGQMPGMLEKCVADPKGTRHALVREQSRLEIARAERLFDDGEAGRPAGVLALYRAALLDPLNEEAGTKLRAACMQGRFSFERSQDPRILETEEALLLTPQAPGLLKRAADLHRGAGNVHLAAVHLRRYLRERPDDTHAQHQLELLLAGPHTRTFVGIAGPKSKDFATQDILEGIRTGGFKAVDKQTALELQAPSLSILPTASDDKKAKAKAKAPETLVVRERMMKTAVSAEQKERIAEASQTLQKKATQRAPRVVSSVVAGGSATDEPAFKDYVSGIWNAWGKLGAAGLLVFGLLGCGIWVVSRMIRTGIDVTQTELSDNTAQIGRIEQNALERVVQNHLEAARGAHGRGEHLKVVRETTTLLGMEAPGPLALEALYLRGNARLALKDKDSARRDFIEYLAKAPLRDARRDEVKKALDAL